MEIVIDLISPNDFIQIPQFKMNTSQKKKITHEVSSLGVQFRPKGYALSHSLTPKI